MRQPLKCGKAGDNDRQIQMFLDHKNLNTTQVYLKGLDGEPADDAWRVTAERLGLAAEGEGGDDAVH